MVEARRILENELRKKEIGRGCALRRGRFGRLLAMLFVMKVVVVAEWYYQLAVLHTVVEW